MSIMKKIRESFGLGEPQTVTVKIPYHNQSYCEVTYIANDELTKQIARHMSHEGYKAYKGLGSMSEKLNDIEKERGLKRHNIIGKYGDIVPGFQDHRIFPPTGQHETRCEFWKRGHKAQIDNIHCYTISGDSDPYDMGDGSIFKVTDEKALATFKARYALMREKAQQNGKPAYVRPYAPYPVYEHG